MAANATGNSSGDAERGPLTQQRGAEFLASNKVDIAVNRQNEKELPGKKLENEPDKAMEHARAQAKAALFGQQHKNEKQQQAGLAQPDQNPQAGIDVSNLHFQGIARRQLGFEVNPAEAEKIATMPKEAKAQCSQIGAGMFNKFFGFDVDQANGPVVANMQDGQCVAPSSSVVADNFVKAPQAVERAPT